MEILSDSLKRRDYPICWKILWVFQKTEGMFSNYKKQMYVWKINNIFTLQRFFFLQFPTKQNLVKSFIKAVLIRFQKNM